ncbi:restriction endonuclease subunit S [Enorma massiliensis]|uniref:restriction endonuclease subunit S n=1 Tax=Enorma massiliensis TaxID=1472761 RepID=UPI0023F3ACEB|nr:restriction endonuclease subunit S [Enorma massiliensis]
MRAKLGDVCASIYDGDHNAPPKSESGIPFITISNIDANDGFIDFSNTSFVPEEYYKSLKGERKPKRGDVLYSVVGSFGIPSLLKDDKRFVFQRHIAILRPSEKLDSTYLYYLLKDSSFYHWADAVAIGSAQRTVTLGQLRSKGVNLPDLETQRRIAGVLSAYDELIENNRKQIKLLEEAARRLYKEWFVDLRFPGHETAHIHNGVPEGWHTGSLLDLADVVRGCSYSSDEIVNGGKTLINLGNLTPFGGFRLGYAKPYSGKSRDDQAVAKGDVIMGLTEQAVGLAGYAALLPAIPNGSVISADLVKLVPHAGVSAVFVYAVLRFGRLSELISPLANGTKIKHLRPESLSRVAVLLPSKRLANDYAELVAPLYDQISICDQRICTAREARSRLLPKLMSGEIKA